MKVQIIAGREGQDLIKKRYGSIKAVKTRFFGDLLDLIPLGWDKITVIITKEYNDGKKTGY